MGLLNRKPAPVAPTTGIAAVLEHVKPPYKVNDMLSAVLDQLSQWIPAEGYYAYATDVDDSGLLLKATRAAAGIATVGPNYAGLVLGGGIRPVPLEITPLADPWALAINADGLLEIGCGAHVVIRVAVDAKFRVTPALRDRLIGWVKEWVPLFDVLHTLESRTDNGAAGVDAVPQWQRSQQDLVFQIPRLMGLLADLGAGVVNSVDGYLALADDDGEIELAWSVGLGQKLAERLLPMQLYEAAREYRVAVWDSQQLSQAVSELGFQSFLVIPVTGSQGSFGVLCLATTHPLRHSPSLIDTLRYLSDSLANSLQSRGAAAVMGHNYLDSLLTATTLLDEADPYNKAHHEQVSRLCARLAMQAGWSDGRVGLMELAGRLHDVGMIAVALDLTRAKGNLAEQARALVQQHAAIGFELLSGLPETILPRAVARAVREHHERYDGLGYPDGIAGENISEEGRVLACAEQFVARISARSYRPGLSVERALYDVEQLSGNQLDPNVVQWLIKLYAAAGVRPQAPV
jgi:HD-GYP domain-containing protein (c-di-GMP phosphodiesterase class II)